MRVEKVEGLSEFRAGYQVEAIGVRKSAECKMPNYVRLEIECYPVETRALMSPDDARMLARELLAAADAAEGR